jgi:hypothetical protein
MLSDAIDKYFRSFLCVFYGLSPGTLLSHCSFASLRATSLKSVIKFFSNIVLYFKVLGEFRRRGTCIVRCILFYEYHDI